MNSKLGFTNKMAVALVGLLTLGLFMSFALAVYSIRRDYMGPLACFTVVFTPIGTGLSITLTAIVNKSKAENLGSNGEGIVYHLNKQEGGI